MVPPIAKKLVPAKLKDLNWNDRSKKTANKDLLPAWTNEIDEILEEIHNANQASAIMTIRKPYSDAFRRNRAEIEMEVQNQPDADGDILQLYMVRLYNKDYEEKTLDELHEIA